VNTESDEKHGARMAQPFWIECDIDGAGRRWRLAYRRSGEIVFPMEGFADAADAYDAYPRHTIAPPGSANGGEATAPRHIEVREDGVALDKADAADNAFALFVLAALFALGVLVWRLCRAWF